MWVASLSLSRQNCKIQRIHFSRYTNNNLSSILWSFRESKSKPNEPQHFSNFVMLKLEHCYAQMWLLVVWTFQPSIGLFNSIHQMIQRYALNCCFETNFIISIWWHSFIFLNHQEYIHRVGRTARGEGSSGHALLILRPDELGFLRYLKQAKVPLNEFEFSWSKIADIQLQVSNNLFLKVKLLRTKIN